MPPKKTTSSTSRDVKASSGSPKKAGAAASSSSSGDTGGGSGSGSGGASASRPWVNAEDAVFYRAMVRGYKPNWDEIMTALDEVAAERRETRRTKKSAMLRFDRYIKKPLLDKAEAQGSK